MIIPAMKNIVIKVTSLILNVFGECRAVNETFSTTGAGKWPVPGVFTHVDL